MDSSSIQFSGTCVASKLRRYCRRASRASRSATEVIAWGGLGGIGPPEPVRYRERRHLQLVPQRAQRALALGGSGAADDGFGRVRVRVRRLAVRVRGSAVRDPPPRRRRLRGDDPTMRGAERVSTRESPLPRGQHLRHRRPAQQPRAESLEVARVRRGRVGFARVVERSKEAKTHADETSWASRPPRPTPASSSSAARPSPCR